MTTRIAAGLVTASLAIGILVGAAGTIVVREAGAPRLGTMTDMAGAMGALGGTGGMASVMAMMGSGMMGADPMSGPQGPGPRMSPGPWHDLHHPAASPGAAQ
jgi:hypothetical protein